MLQRRIVIQRLAYSLQPSVIPLLDIVIVRETDKVERGGPNRDGCGDDDVALQSHVEPREVAVGAFGVVSVVSTVVIVGCVDVSMNVIGTIGMKTFEDSEEDVSTAAIKIVGVGATVIGTVVLGISTVTAVTGARLEVH